MNLPIKIGDNNWERVDLPASLEERFELLGAYAVAKEEGELFRVWACALALCWPLLRKHLDANRTVYSGAVLSYGRAAMDALLTDGAPRSTVRDAGRYALDEVARALRPVVQAMQDAPGFSPLDGSAGPSGNSSPSSGSPASNPGPSGPSTPT